MGSYPDVVPGDRVTFNANRENEINHFLNAANGFGDGVFSGRTTPNVRLQVWNASNSTLLAGQVVQIAVTGHTMCGDAFPVLPFAGNPDMPIGVLNKILDANEMGDLVMSGVAKVEITGGTAGYYAKPLINQKATRGDEGLRILNLSDVVVSGVTHTYATVLLGDYRKPDYKAGKGISEANLSGGTISTDIIGGTDIDVTGTTQLTIAYTGTTGATGIGSTISGNSATITLSGGTGSVTISGGDNVEITGTNNSITISVTGSTGGGGGGGGGGGDTDGIVRHIFGSTIGVYQLAENSDNMVYYPQPYNSNGQETYEYNFGTSAGRTAAISAIEAVIGKSVVDTDDGFTDDNGNMILILPLNPSDYCSVRVYTAPGSTRVLVVSVEGKRIVDNNGGTQGDNNGVYTDYVDAAAGLGNDYLYVYVSSTAGWPSRYAYGYNFDNVKSQCARTPPGCWVRINLS